MTGALAFENVDILFTSFEGFAIPYLGSANLGRSAHTLSGFVGVLLLALGLVWPRLELGAAARVLRAPGLALTALDQMSDAVAHAVLLFSKRNFDKDPLTTPIAAPAAKAVTTASGSDSGPHPAHDHDESVDR